MNRVKHFCIKRFYRTIPLYFKVKRCIRRNDLNSFVDCVDKIFDLCNIRINVNGVDKLSGIERLVIFANHQSLFDPLFLIKMINKNVSFVAKNELEKSKIMRDVFSLNKSVFIDRKDARDSLKKILELNSRLKNEDCILGIFPEGTRSKNGLVGEFKPGSFKLGTGAQVPIAIVSIKGALNLETTNDNRVIEINVLEVLDKDKYKDIKSKDLASYCEKLIKDDLNQ